jgi:hypothetical protein
LVLVITITRRLLLIIIGSVSGLKITLRSIPCMLLTKMVFELGVKFSRKLEPIGIFTDASLFG